MINGRRIAALIATAIAIPVLSACGGEGAGALMDSKQVFDYNDPAQQEQLEQKLNAVEADCKSSNRTEQVQCYVDGVKDFVITATGIIADTEVDGTVKVIYLSAPRGAGFERLPLLCPMSDVDGCKHAGKGDTATVEAVIDRRQYIDEPGPTMGPFITEITKK